LDSNQLSDRDKTMANLITKFRSEYEKYKEPNSRVCDLARAIHSGAIRSDQPAPVPEDLLGQALLDLLTNTDAMGGWLDHLQRSNRLPVVILSLPPIKGDPAAMIERLREKLSFRIELSDPPPRPLPNDRKLVPEFRIHVESCQVPMARHGDYVTFCFRADPAPQAYYGVFSVKGTQLETVVWCGYIS